MPFSGIFFNGKEYNEMWFEGNRLWQKGEIDYSQYINLEEMARGYETAYVFFQDYDEYLSPYWASFNGYNGVTVNKARLIIPIPTTINTEYVLVKGLVKTNGTSSTSIRVWGEGSTGISFTLGEEVVSFDGAKYYEFEVLLSCSSKEMRFGFYSNASNKYDKYAYGQISIGNVTMQPVVSATSEYGMLVKEANYPYIRSITLESSLTDTTIIQGTTFTITPTVLPTNYVGDEIVLTYDTNYLSYDGTTFTVLDTATFGEETTITYSSKLNPSASATYTIKVKEFVPITSIVLEHNLDIPLTDVPIHTTFTITPIIEPSDYTLSDLQVVYNSDYLITDDNMTFTILEIAEGQVLDIAYMGKTNSIVKSISLTVSGVAYPYPEVDSVVTYVNTSTTSEISKTFTVIDSTLPYSINGVETNTFSFPPNVETQVKLVNLKPCSGGNYIYPIKYEQLRIPNLTDLSDLFYYFAHHEEYEHSWQPQYFELTTNPTAMSRMFSNNEYLTQEMMEQFKPLLKAFNTSQITDMKDMFHNCLLISELDLTNFDMTNVVNKDRMFTNLNATIRVDKDKWLSDTYWCSYGAENAKFILVDSEGNEEQIYQPMYYTEFGVTESLPTWIEKYASTTGSQSSEKFIYGDGHYYVSTDSYYGGSPSITFKVVAPISGYLRVYTSQEDDGYADREYIYFGENTSSLTQVLSSSSSGTEYDYRLKARATKVYVEEGKTYYIKNQFSQNDSNNRYDGGVHIYGFSVDLLSNIESISLTHDLDTSTDVLVGTIFNVIPTVLPSRYDDDELLIDYDTNSLSMTENQFTVLNKAYGKTLQIIYYSKNDNSINAILEFTVEEAPSVDAGETVLTYDTFNSVAQTESRYLTFTKDETENTMTMQCAYRTSNYYESELYVTTDIYLPKKCRVKVTGESKGSIPYITGYANNQLFFISNLNSFVYYSSYTMPSDGVLYKSGNNPIETSEGATQVGLFQTNPNLTSLGSGNYPFEFDFEYSFDYEPSFNLFCSTHNGSYANSLLTSSYMTYKDLKVEVYIKHCASIDLVSDIEDLTNVTQSTFTITPIILPTDAQEDLVAEYDTNYIKMTKENTFSLLAGSQGKTLSITYKGKYSNVKSNTLTFTVSEDLKLPYIVDFTQSTAPTLPLWLTEEVLRDTYYFTHGTYEYDGTTYGLVESTYPTTTKQFWNCYKVVAPMTGTLEITFRAYTYSSSYPFVIHATSSATQPTYSSTTNQIVKASNYTYRDTDGVATLSVTEGQTYYIHIQHRRYGSSTAYSSCIRSFKITP
jgi:hypothetical protein